MGDACELRTHRGRVFPMTVMCFKLLLVCMSFMIFLSKRLLYKPVISCFLRVGVTYSGGVRLANPSHTKEVSLTVNCSCEGTFLFRVLPITMKEGSTSVFLFAVGRVYFEQRGLASPHFPPKKSWLCAWANGKFFGTLKMILLYITLLPGHTVPKHRGM